MLNAEDTVLARAQGAVEIGFARRHGATRLAHLFQQGCGKARLPNVAPGDPPEAVLINSSGGLTDGDRLRYDIVVGEGGWAAVTTQAAEKIYRSRGLPAVVETRLRAAPGTMLEWLPQESILFDSARLHRTTRIELAGDARFLGCEALVFGRAAHGETMNQGEIRDTWQIHRDGRLAWLDPFRISGAVQDVLDRPAVAAGARATAFIAYCGGDAPALLEPMRGWLAALTIRAGVSLRGDLLLSRLLADTGFALRQALALVLARLREAVAGRAVPMPRVWAC